MGLLLGFSMGVILIAFALFQICPQKIVNFFKKIGIIYGICH